jgi:hypothetical protein
MGAPLGFGNVVMYASPTAVPLPSDQRTIDHWFNTSVFEKSTANALSRNLITLSSRFSGIRGPGINMLDMSVIKSTTITERIKAQLRVGGDCDWRDPVYSPCLHIFSGAEAGGPGFSDRF